MACGIVRSAITTVIKKTPSQSPRSCKLRMWAQEILDKACQGDAEMEDFDCFSVQILKTLREMISSIVGRYSGTLEDTRVVIEGKLREMGNDPAMVQVQVLEK
jgi:hypothetical protein